MYNTIALLRRDVLIEVNIQRKRESMGPNINAVGIIFVPVFAIAVSLIWRTAYDNIRFVKAVLIPVSIVIFTAIIIEFLPKDWHLAFSLQLFLPIVCLFPILWLVENKAVKYAAICVLSVLAISLSVQYVYLSRSGIASTMQPGKAAALDNLQLTIVNFALYTVASHDSNDYPEGWLSDSPFLANLPEERRKGIEEHSKFDRPETYWLWHTSLTHLYGVKQRKHQELWYPGGKLSQDTIRRISCRDRPSETDNK
jgi:hypothetical protein